MAIPTQYNNLQHAMQWSCQNPAIHIDTTKKPAHSVKNIDFSEVMVTHCPPNMARILTQWAFHRVQEHPKRSSDEEVMVVRSLRSHMNSQP